MKVSKIIGVLALLTLSSIVQGAWVSLAQPIILTLGAAFSALDIDAAPVIDVNWLGWLKLNGIREEKARTHTT